MTIGAILFLVDIIPRMTAHTELIDLLRRIHDTGRCAIAARGPGFIGDVGITIAVAIRAADVGLCMGCRKLFLRIVQMANVAATIVSYRFVRQVNI